MSTFTDEQKETLKDLLKEKSLWQVYRASRRVRFSSVNIGVGFAVAAVVAIAAFTAGTPSGLADQLLVLSSLAFGLSIGQLGFLLAGFSFFATVADKEMFCRMAEKIHAPSGLSWLKYNFFVFMRVFVEYLIFSVICLVLMVVLPSGIGFRELLVDYLSYWQISKLFVGAVSFGLFVGCLFYLVLQLASFIYNIYHVVMTSIRWALQQHYQQINASSQADTHSETAASETSGGNDEA